jgi:uncharacterized membrane protein
MSIFHEKWEVQYMTKEEFINHLLEVKAVLEKLAKKQEVYDEIERRLYEEYGKEESIRNEKQKMKTRICAVIMLIVIAVCFFTGIIKSVYGSIIPLILVMVAMIVARYKGKNGRINEEYYNQKILPIKKELNQQEKVILAFMNSDEMKNLSDVIPQKYLNLKAVLFLLEVLQTGRADSAKEAYNLYEEELHREKIQEMQEEKLDYARETLREQQNQTKVQKRISRQVSYGNYINTKNYYHNRWGRK